MDSSPPTNMEVRRKTMKLLSKINASRAVYAVATIAAAVAASGAGLKWY